MKNILLWVIVALVVILGIYSWFVYNSFVSLNESADAQWAKVETQYQRRFDLIPNLVNSVKGAMAQEQTVFKAIADARTRYAGATTPNEKAEAASQVESSLARLLVVMENYPTLASIGTVQDLMAQLEGTENRVSVERMRFNEVVKDYNLATKRFPRNLLAGIFGFGNRAYFESTEGSENAPQVNF